MVFGPGNDYSPLGHVAYVESVVKSSRFIVDEANVDGLGIVDQRLISSLTDVEGFNYRRSAAFVRPLLRQRGLVEEPEAARNRNGAVRGTDQLGE